MTYPHQRIARLQLQLLAQERRDRHKLTGTVDKKFGLLHDGRAPHSQEVHLNLHRHLDRESIFTCVAVRQAEKKSGLLKVPRRICSVGTPQTAEHAGDGRGPRRVRQERGNGDFRTPRETRNRAG